MRIGFGFDVHQLVPGRKLILGGIDISHSLGLLGHSDADVLIHAVIDALLGAANLGDIGTHFPDSDHRYKDISSIELLRHTARLIEKSGWKIGNIDSVIMAERPKISSYIPEMKNRIATALAVDSDQISIKATTTEKLGFVGREEGIAAESVVLLQKSN